MDSFMDGPIQFPASQAQILFGWRGRARTYDILINSQTQLPTVLHATKLGVLCPRTKDIKPDSANLHKFGVSSRN